jgi:hypothetical protein
MFCLQQNWKRRQNRFCLEVRGERGRGKGDWEQGGEMAQTMYTHMNNCINNKVRNDKERERMIPTNPFSKVLKSFSSFCN